MNSQTTEVFRHIKRPNWGLAVLTQARPDRRRYHFEDGTQRTILKGYYHLFEQVQPDVIPEVLIPDPKTPAAEIKAHWNERRYVAEQIEAFRARFPAGFRGEVWLKEMRGEGRKRLAKRHRNRPVQLAAKLLSPERYEEARSAQDLAPLFDDLIQVLRSTELLSVARDIKPLEALSAASRQNVIEGLFSMLHTGGSVQRRLSDWVSALAKEGIEASWALATAPLALAHPSSHVLVRPSAFRKQLGLLFPRAKFSKRPTGSCYRQLLEMTALVDRHLKDLEMAPTDYLDVAEFIHLVNKSTTRRAKTSVALARAA